MFLVGFVLWAIPTALEDDDAASTEATESNEAESIEQVTAEEQPSSFTLRNDRSEIAESDQFAETSISSNALTAIMTEPITDTGLAIGAKLNAVELTDERTSAQVYALWGVGDAGLQFQTEPVSVSLLDREATEDYVDLTDVTIISSSQLAQAQYSYRIVVTFDDGTVLFSSPTSIFIGG